MTENEMLRREWAHNDRKSMIKQLEIDIKICQNFIELCNITGDKQAKEVMRDVLGTTQAALNALQWTTIVA